MARDALRGNVSQPIEDELQTIERDAREVELQVLRQVRVFEAKRPLRAAEELAEAARLPEYRRDWPDVLLRRLQRFETALAKVRDEFGRASGARG